MAKVEVEVVGPLLLTRTPEKEHSLEVIIAVGLNEKGGQRGYLIQISEHQANAIGYFLTNKAPPQIFRPYVDATRRFIDFFGASIEKLDAKLDRVSVTELPDENTQASVHINCNNKEVIIPVKKSTDAIVVALRLKCGIYMNEEFMREREYIDVSKIVTPQEEVPSIESLDIDWSKVKD